MTQLQTVYSDKAKIPAGAVEFFVERDGKFYLDAEGIKTQTDFDNYAEALKKRMADEVADIQKKAGNGVSRDEIMGWVKEAASEMVKAGSGGGKSGSGDKGDGAGSEVLARLHDLERDVASLTETNKKLESERDEAVTKGRQTTIRNELSTAAQKAGATPEGIGNLVTLVENSFEVAQDGSVVTKLDAGVSPNQKPDDYFAAIARDPSYRMFWGKSVGAGAGGDGAGGPGGGGVGADNPWTKAGWNLTKQGTLYKSDPTEAKRLMDAAGVKLGATTPVR